MRASTATDVAVLVFARAPVPGAAKTRLIPRLGAWRAARLQMRLTERALLTASTAGETRLCVTPRRNHASFLNFKKRFDVVLELQKGRDLGERMRNSVEKALRLRSVVIVIGTDCPALTPRDLRRAARLLRGDCDAVLAPAEDGGYALIGLRKLRGALFEGIEWGGPHVLRDTLARKNDLKVKLLRTVWDVDRPQDLERLGSLGPRSRRSF